MTSQNIEGRAAAAPSEKLALRAGAPEIAAIAVQDIVSVRAIKFKGVWVIEIFLQGGISVTVPLDEESVAALMKFGSVGCPGVLPERPLPEPAPHLHSAEAMRKAMPGALRTDFGGAAQNRIAAPEFCELAKMKMKHWSKPLQTWRKKQAKVTL